MESNASTSGSVTRVTKHRVLLPLTETQKKFYRMVMENNYRALIDAGLQKHIPNGSNIGPLLQKVCIHPFLVPVFEEYLSNGQTPEKINELLFNGTARFNYITKLYEQCKQDKERLVVICSRNEALDLLASALESKGCGIIIINSKVKAALRQGEINKFNSSTEYCLIISAKLAPSFNISADKVIVHDLTASDKELVTGDYNFIAGPKVDVRCLLSEHSYEQIAFEKMLGHNLAFLPSAAYTSWPELGSAPKQNDLYSLPQTAQGIEQLLRYGAYNTFKEESIDEILEKSTTSVDPATTFQKASFVVNTEEPQIDINDPDFWAKVLPSNDSTSDGGNNKAQQPDTHRYNTRNKNK